MYLVNRPFRLEWRPVRLEEAAATLASLSRLPLLGGLVTSLPFAVRRVSFTPIPCKWYRGAQWVADDSNIQTSGA